MLKDVYAKQAEIRKKESLRQNVKKFIDVRESSTTKGIKFIDDMAHGFGRTRDKLTKVSPLKRDKISQLLYIGEKYDAKDKNAIRVMNELNAGELSYDAACKKLKLMEISESGDSEAKVAKRLVRQIDKKEITPNKALFLLLAHTRNSEIPPPPVKELPEGIYNVIVADPPSIDDAKKMQITEAKDAVLFLWAKPSNIKKMLELMETWDFKLKSIAVWIKENTLRDLFHDDVGFLLLGIRGNMEPPVKQFPITFTAPMSYDLDTKKRYKPDIVYDIAEQMFPNQKYLDPFLEGGWRELTYQEASGTEQKNDDVTNESLTDSMTESELPEKSTTKFEKWL